MNKCDDVEKNTIAEYYQRCFWRRFTRILGKYSNLDEKDENLKEKFKQALISTVKAISEDLIIIPT